jgi:hypothetical protein
MRAVAFFKTVVPTAGTPVNLGVSTLGAAMGVGDTSLTITSANPFSPDMCPFLLTIDVGALQEKVEISAINGTTFTISQRGAAGTAAQSHLTAVAARADDFHIAGFSASANVANVGNAYLGTRGMATGGGAGTIKRFAVTGSGGIDDSFEKMLNSDSGDPGVITEFKIDVASSGDALNFVAWVR